MTTDQFQQFADLLPGGAVLLTANGKIVAASAGVKKFWQLEPQVLIGQSLPQLMRGDAAEITAFLQKCLVSKQVVNCQLTLADSGLVLTCQGRALGESTADEAIVLSGLSASVGGAASANNTAADLRDRLLAVMVHDFRNGLASVPMGFDVLEMERGKSETINLLRRQTDRLVQLVDEVLDLSRLLRGKIVLRPEKVVMQEIIQEAANSASTALQQRKLTLSLELPGEPISLMVDPQRFVQALKELVAQRSKNLPAGEQLKLSLTKTATDVEIRLVDSGQPIDPILMPHVFDLLSQLEYSGTEARVQLELGLALAGGLISLHGGRIHAQPLMPKGLEIQIQMPLVVATA